MDIHLQFSETIKCTEWQALWLKKEINIAAAHDNGPLCEHSYHADAEYIWVHDSRASKVRHMDSLLLVVAHFQCVFKIEKPWAIQWSWTCEKPRIGGFGGGAAVVYKGDIHFLDTWKWCCKKIYELTKE